MKLINSRYCLVLFLRLLAFVVSAQENVKIAVISDVHFFSEKLAPTDKAMQLYEEQTGRNIPILHEILDTVLNRISKENPDFLFISGDITNHGERQSHLDFVSKLQPLREKGTRIFVIPGNHDINIPNSKKYTDTENLSTESVSAKEFTEIYRDFGYEAALKRDDASLSYLAKLNNNTHLLCFDTNRYAEHKTNSISSGRILPETMQWALDILREAQEKNVTVLGLMHHGLVEHMPYQSTFFAAYLIDVWQKNAQILADAGLKIVFTGHFHSNDASSYTSPSGNIITDVETGSLSQYPFPYRVAEIKANSLQITSHFIESIAGLPNLAEVYREKFKTNAAIAAEARLKNIGLPLLGETKKSLTELISQMTVLHAAGDEAPDKEMQKAIENLAEIFNSNEVDFSFQLDFPPEDNRLIIDLKNQ